MSDRPERFEEALAQLEDRVRRLEAGELPLEEALLLYEQGVELARTCHEQLEDAEERVKALQRTGTGIAERPMADVDR
ncbi:MAG: exodeoxyribonuclease VII small subunit [Myxococcales bacterium]|nr:exodeoxyribonuclease VII small subunit [Myxococcales bacterium]MCB9673176.1 exodeoxyribonuclease VII small subunit [Alphaproteobacteria bacterium]